jgi:hypothetical protein
MSFPFSYFNLQKNIREDLKIKIKFIKYLNDQKNASFVLSGFVWREN